MKNFKRKKFDNSWWKLHTNKNLLSYLVSLLLNSNTLSKSTVIVSSPHAPKTA